MEQRNLKAAKPANYTDTLKSIRMASRHLLNTIEATNKNGININLHPITNEVFGLTQLIFSV
ncbi:hypothetical protein [Spirosoma jeollabukense]